MLTWRTQSRRPQRSGPICNKAQGHINFGSHPTAGGQGLSDDSNLSSIPSRMHGCVTSRQASDSPQPGTGSETAIKSGLQGLFQPSLVPGTGRQAEGSLHSASAEPPGHNELSSGSHPAPQASLSPPLSQCSVQPYNKTLFPLWTSSVG